MEELKDQLEWEDDLDLDLVELPLSTQNRVHDRTQFESKFDFELADGTAKARQKSYEVDLYFFFPSSMGVSSDSYSRKAFYGDLTHLLRVRTPELKRRKGGLFVGPRLSSVEAYFESHLDTVRRSQLSQLVVHDTRLFGCLVYTELKRLQSDLNRVVKRARTHNRPELVAGFHDRLRHRLESVHGAIRSYRERYIWPIKTEPILLDHEVQRSLLLVDEYLSYRLESTAVGMYSKLEPFGVEVEDLLHQIEALLTGELAYRQEHLQAAVRPGKSRVESHYYRLGLLKKYVSEVLFLDTRRINKDYVYRNFIAAFGAGLAAFFATLTNIQTFQMVSGQEEVGVRIFTLLALGVTAYIFKDRIKDLSKDYFNHRLKSWLPDYDVQMFYTHYSSEGNPEQVYLGTSQELVRYLSRSKLPPDIDYVREIGHRNELEPERLETVINYNKRMKLDVNEELREHFGNARVKRIHDVLRFDVSHFLAKLADPQKRLSYFDPEKGIVTTEAPKLYHLNLVFRYVVGDWQDGQCLKETVDYERLRVVLNKKGIVRVENVLSRGEIGHEDRQPHFNNSVRPAGISLQRLVTRKGGR